MTLSIQFITMLTMAFAGALSTSAFDTYKRLLRPQVYWQQFFIDVLFFLTMGSVVYYLLFLANGGILRFYLVIAFLLGVSAYYALIQSFFLRLLEVVIRLVINVYYFIKNLTEIFVIRPTVWIFFLTFSIIVATGKFLLKVIILLFKVIFTILSPFIPGIVKKHLIIWAQTCDNIIRNWWKILVYLWEKRRQNSVKEEESKDE
ncbi:spore cortex biosynthesis protein YabQ [Alkalibacillus silvisoli]|uniref:Spore cortex biosynthesis protein YabQ n=1 Tax=Alkalibacillus silvisoli TaxID=392823 RepID=A0ABN1A456_9BACI